MKLSFDERFRRQLAKTDETGWSEWTILCDLIRGSNYPKDKIREAYLRLMPKEDRYDSPLDQLLPNLYALSTDPKKPKAEPRNQEEGPIEK